MNLFEKAKQLVEQNKDEIINDLSELIQHKSVIDPKTISPNMPCGENIHNTFKFLEGKLKQQKMNVDFFPNDNYMLIKHDLEKDHEDTVLLAAHIDTVDLDEEKNWFFKSEGGALSGKVQNDIIYGRGALDDKGPLITILWTLKIFKQMGMTFPFNLNLFIGGDEETLSTSQYRFIEKNKLPKLTLVADGQFPFTYGEFNIYNYSLEVKCDKDDIDLIQSIQAPKTLNMVPPHCDAVVKMDFEVLKKPFFTYLYENKLDGSITKVSENSDLVKIHIIGEATHSITCEKGKNAITHLFDFLYKFSNNRIIAFISEVLHKNFNGYKFGINKYSKEYDKDTIFNVGSMTKTADGYNFGLNIRFLSSMWDRKIVEYGVEDVTKKYFDFAQIKNTYASEGYLIDPNNKLLISVYDSYKSVTNDYSSKPGVTAGGTYARYFPNAICFGILPSDEDYKAHCVNESLTIHSLLESIKIYLKVLLDLKKLYII